MHPDELFVIAARALRPVLIELEKRNLQANTPKERAGIQKNVKKIEAFIKSLDASR